MPELAPQFAEQSPTEGERATPRVHFAIILAAGLVVRLFLIHRILVHARLSKDRLRSYATLSVGRFANKSTTSVTAPAQPSPRPRWIALGER